MSGRLRLAPTRRAAATSASRARQEARPSWRAHRSCCSCKGLAPVLELVRCAYGLAPLLTLMAEFQTRQGHSKAELPSLHVVRTNAAEPADCPAAAGLQLSRGCKILITWPAPIILAPQAPS